MELTIILLTIAVTIIFAVVSGTLEYYLFPKINSSNTNDDIENQKTMNELYKLYLEIDPVRSRQLIDDLIDSYLKEYTLYHIATQETVYIKSEQIEEMIKVITETAYINLSDFYTFHIKILINVRDEEDILGYLRDRVKTAVMLYAAEINQPT